MDKSIENLIQKIEKQVSYGSLETTNADLLIKLIKNADNLEEAKKIASMGTIFRTTGIYFDKRFELEDGSIKYFAKNEKLSFKTSEDTLTHKLIIGDNYDTLRNLLITHRNAIDIIYIDPPYGSDSMGEFAKTNYENRITRDNLLSMLQPRLELAKDLLSDNGIIFCSIDDRNHAYIKCLFDEVFDENNFIGDIIWKKNANKNNTKTLSITHEYILCYCKNITSFTTNSENQEFFKEKKSGLEEVYKILQKCEKAGKTFEETENELKTFYKKNPELKGISQYKYVDYGPIDKSLEGQKHLKAYRLDNSSAPQAIGKANTYEVLHPKTGIPCKCPTTGWRFTWDTMQENIRKGLIYFYDDHTKVPQFKRYLDTVPTDICKSVIEDFTDGKKELQAIFTESIFANPKPTTLIKTIIGMMTRVNKDAIILDFFAGSGTTGQAVLELNKEDGGKRQFILCTNNEKDDINKNGIAYDVTTKRLKRIMTGECYDGNKEFPWIKRNKAYGDNLDVYEIKTVSTTCHKDADTPFDVIDETLYNLPKFNNFIKKMEWVCENFERTQNKIQTDDEWIKEKFKKTPEEIEWLKSRGHDA